MANALVIDDNRSMADSLVRLLKALGLQARAAYGPGPGMLLLRAEKPDVLFLDINMPGLSGFEILSFVVREPGLSNIPVVVVTSDDQPQTRQHALRNGAKEVLIKPVMVEGLEKVLRGENLM